MSDNASLNVQTYDRFIQNILARLKQLEETTNRNIVNVKQNTVKMAQYEISSEEEKEYFKRKIKRFKQRDIDYERIIKEQEERIDRVTGLIDKLKDLLSARLRVHMESMTEFLGEREQKIRDEMQESFQVIGVQQNKQLTQLHEHVDRQWKKQKDYLKKMNSHWSQQMDSILRNVILGDTAVKTKLEQYIGDNDKKREEMESNTTRIDTLVQELTQSTSEKLSEHDATLEETWKNIQQIDEKHVQRQDHHEQSILELETQFKQLVPDTEEKIENIKKETHQNRKEVIQMLATDWDRTREEMNLLKEQFNNQHASVNDKVDSVDRNAKERMDRITHEAEKMEQELKTSLEKMNQELNVKVTSVEQEMKTNLEKVDEKMEKKMEQLTTNVTERVDTLTKETNSKLDGMSTSMNTRMDTLTIEMKTNDEQIGNRIDSLGKELETTNVNLQNKLDTLEKETKSNIDKLTSDTTARIDTLEKDTNLRIEKTVTDVNNKIEALEKSATESIESLGKETTSKFDTVGIGLKEVNDKIEALGKETNVRIEALSTDTNTKIETITKDMNVIGELGKETAERVKSLTSGTDTKLDALWKELNEKITTLNEKTETQDKETNIKIESLSSDTNSRIDALERSVDTKIGETTKQIDELSKDTATKLEVLTIETKKIDINHTQITTRVDTLAKQVKQFYNLQSQIDTLSANLMYTSDQIFESKLSVELQLVMDHLIDTVEYNSAIQDTCDSLIDQALETFQSDVDEKFTEWITKEEKKSGQALTALEKRVQESDLHTTNRFGELEEHLSGVQTTIGLHQVVIDLITNSKLDTVEKRMEESIEKRIIPVQDQITKQNLTLKEMTEANEKRSIETNQSIEKRFQEMNDSTKKQIDQQTAQTNDLREKLIDKQTQLETKLVDKQSILEKQLVEKISTTDSKQKELEKQITEVDKSLQAHRLESVKESSAKYESMNQTIHKYNEQSLAAHQQFIDKVSTTIKDSLSKYDTILDTNKTLAERVESINARLQKIENSDHEHYQQMIKDVDTLRHVIEEHSKEANIKIHDHSEHFILQSQQIGQVQQAIEELKHFDRGGNNDEVKNQVVLLSARLETVIDQNKLKIVEWIDTAMEKKSKLEQENLMNKLEGVRNGIEQKVDHLVGQLREDTNHNLQTHQLNNVQMLENFKTGSDLEIQKIHFTISTIEEKIPQMQENLEELTTSDEKKKQQIEKMNERLEKSERDVSHLVASVFDHVTPRT
jgi:DNA repair exonuclease SbcCD ATPase subunit